MACWKPTDVRLSLLCLALSAETATGTVCRLCCWRRWLPDCRWFPPALTGIPEIIDHGENGLIVPPGNPTALARALAGLLQNGAYRAKMGAAAQQKVERAFDVRQNVSQLHRWLAEPVLSPAYQPTDVVIDAPYSPVLLGGLS